MLNLSGIAVHELREKTRMLPRLFEPAHKQFYKHPRSSYHSNLSDSDREGWEMGNRRDCRDVLQGSVRR